MSADPFSRGTRDNGLRCAGYVVLADLDPRVADAMLVVLRAEGIAAYAAPAPAESGWHGEVRMSPVPRDRLWVDGEQLDRARDLLNAEEDRHPLPAPPMTAAGDTDEVDFDAGWQEVLTSLRGPSVHEPEGRWPERENVAADDTEESAYDDTDDEVFDPADGEHYVPPPAPPLPRLRTTTIASLFAMGLGLLVLAFDVDGGTFRVPAFIAIVGGAVSLVWNMRQGPPTDSGWDDGAVV